MPKRILIIEDDRDLASLLAARLIAAGFEVHHAADALMGLQAAQRFTPQLIILDLGLPAGGGRSLLERLRASIVIGAIPVVVLTASEDQALKAQILQLGVAAYMHKPYDATQVLAEISRIFDGESAPERPAPQQQQQAADERELDGWRM